MKLLYTPCTDIDEARRIASALLDDKLIACANLFPVTSLYSWEDDVKEEGEVVLLVKTRDAKAGRVCNRIIELHSYDTPCVLTLTADANQAFATWVDSETI